MYDSFFAGSEEDELEEESSPQNPITENKTAALDAKGSESSSFRSDADFQEDSSERVKTEEKEKQAKVGKNYPMLGPCDSTKLNFINQSPS